MQVLVDVFGDAAYSAYAAWQWGETGADGGAEDINAFLANGPNAVVREYWGMPCTPSRTPASDPASSAMAR